jgi:hypothetical protein
MRRAAQRINNPDIKTRQCRDRLVRKTGDIAGIGKISDAKTQRLDIAVNLRVMDVQTDEGRRRRLHLGEDFTVDPRDSSLVAELKTLFGARCLA